MTSERHQMLAGLDSRKFAALIRQILADIAAHAIGAPIARVLTQPKSLAEIQTDPLSAGREQINAPHTKDFAPRKKIAALAGPRSSFLRNVRFTRRVF
jgi:hypothetical protein